jgi:iron complex outermembrane recepter protein
LVKGPFNGGGGYINGVELTFQTPFYFIPNLENFGIYSNYDRILVNAGADEVDRELHPL